MADTFTPNLNLTKPELSSPDWGPKASGNFDILDAKAGDLLTGFAKAGLPAPGTAGRIARVTDDLRGLWMDQGSQWFALNVEIVNVKEFGLVGDDATDNASLWTTLVSNLPSGPVIIDFGSGIFRTSTAFALDRDNVFIRLRQGTEIKTTSATINAFEIGAGSTVRQNIRISGGSFTTNVSKTAGAAADFNKVNNFRLDNFRIINHFEGVRFEDCGIAYLDHGEIRWSGVASPSNAVGVVIDGNNDQYLSHLLLDGGAETPQGAIAGIRILQSGGVWIDNSDIIRYGRGLLVDPQGTDAVVHLFVTNTAFDTNLNEGILLNPGASATIQRAQFTACWTGSNTGNGVSTGGSGTINGVLFLGHRSYLNGNHGVIFNGGSELAYCYGEVAGNSATSSGSLDGIAVVANISNFRLIGNRIGPIGGASNTQRYGINVVSGSSDNYIVSDNDARGNVTGGITDNGSGTNKIVRNNLGHITEKWGNASDTTDGNGNIVIAHGLVSTPSFVTLGLRGDNVNGVDVESVDGTNITARVKNASGADVTSTAVVVDWQARI